MTEMTTRAAARTERTIKSSMNKREPNPFDILTTSTPKAQLFGPKAKAFSIEPYSGAVTAQVKPKILESKVGQRDEFFNLSSGFKKIFADDKKDRKLIIPVVGYGGHRRGDRSQN